MSERPSWIPSDEEIEALLMAVHKPKLSIYQWKERTRSLLSTAVEKALLEQANATATMIERTVAEHKLEVLEARIEELDNATATVCQGCAEGMDYFPGDGSHRQQISDDGDCEGGPCTCHELSDRLHGLRAELAALDATDREGKA